MATTVLEDGTPVLPVRRAIDRHTITVWCEHCRREHCHGRHDGHRVARHSDSPYIEKGYEIQGVRVDS